MAVDKLDIWNRALGRISAGTVASVGETSMTAGYCRRFYGEVLSNMLEGPHEFSFAKQRVSLSLAASNDRPAEWLYAYQLPSDMASAVRVIPDLTAVGVVLPTPLPGNPFAETWATFLDDIAVDYVIDGSTLYCNAENAILEYVVSDVTGLPNIPAMVTKAMAVELASLLAASPVKRDKSLSSTLAGEAELAWSRAIADDRNRQPERWGTYTSEAMLARHDDLWDR